MNRTCVQTITVVELGNQVAVCLAVQAQVLFTFPPLGAPRLERPKGRALGHAGGFVTFAQGKPVLQDNS